MNIISLLSGVNWDFTFTENKMFLVSNSNVRKCSHGLECSHDYVVKS